MTVRRLRRVERKARKAWYCWCCCKQITIGESYVAETNADECDIWTLHMHKSCAGLFDQFAQEHRMDADELESFTGQSDFVEWAESQ